MTAQPRRDPAGAALTESRQDDHQLVVDAHAGLHVAGRRVLLDQRQFGRARVAVVGRGLGGGEALEGQGEKGVWGQPAGGVPPPCWGLLQGVGWGSSHPRTHFVLIILYLPN